MGTEKSRSGHKNVASIYPLSPMQEGMLFHSLYTPNHGTYCSQTLITLNGEMNPAAFKQAWETVVERHGVLRTLFLWEKRQKPLQIVRQRVDLPWDYQDWQPLSPREQQERLEALLHSERQRGFVLNQAPLTRCYLIRLSAQNYQFLWNRHHILLDGWSGAIIYGEVLLIYQALLSNKNNDLPPTPPYEDYIVWLQQQDPSIATTFWREYLRGFTLPTPLGIKGSVFAESPNQPLYREEKFSLSPASTATLQAFVQKHNLTLSTLVQAGWAILLSRYSGESQVLFGITVSGRGGELSGVENMVGLLINTLPLRVTVQGSEEILPWLKELSKNTANLTDYAYSSLAEIQALSDVPPGVPLFESLVVFENYPRSEPAADSVNQLSVREVINFEETNYPLTLAVIPKPVLQFQVSYDVGRFTPDSILRLLGHLETLLTAIALNPQQSLGQLPLLTPAEEKQLLIEWNHTGKNYPLEKCLHQLFEEQVRRNPGAIAISYEQQQLTYQVLNERANQLAHYLREKGVKPEVLVGILLERSPLMIIGILAVLKAGGAYVPLDPNTPRDRLGSIITDSAMALLLTQVGLGGVGEDLVELICLDQEGSPFDNYDQENPSRLVTSENLAYVIYTSGSTGVPKGVLIPHRGVVNLVCWYQEAFKITQADRTSHLAGVAFDATVWELWPYLSAGACVTLVPPEIIQSPQDLQDWLISEKITVSFLPTPLAEKVFTLPWPEKLALRILLVGGDKLHLYPPASLPFKVINNYGPTENSVVTTSGWVNPESPSEISPPIGKAIANTQIYILDEQLHPVPIGIKGELHISGVGLARGYLNQPELTAQKFIDHPFSSDESGPWGRSSKLYKTGDLVRYLPDGNIEFIGRIDHQVKLRGLRIELGEIEAVLETHPAVEKTVVILREDQPNHQQIVAYLSSPDFSLNPKKLRHFLQQKLPTYMIPSAFVKVRDFALTPNGKIDVKQLPIPDQNAFVASVYEAPRNPTEMILVNIWQEVLSLEKVGIHDNFFELGGHSLKAITLGSKIQEKLGVVFAIRQVFSHPTIAEQASLLTGEDQEEHSEIVPISRIDQQETYDTSNAQKRFFVLQQMDLNNLAYHIVSTLKLTGEFFPDRFEKAMQLLIDRHESLRTAFILIDGEPRQKVLPHRPFALAFEDWSLEVNAESRILETIHQHCQPFNLETDPLLRAYLYQLSPQNYILVLEIHHIICDGWSMALLAKECLEYYQALVQKIEPKIEPLPIQYKDYAVWQTNHLNQNDQSQSLDYWRKKLDNGQIPRVHLPTDFLRSPLKSFNGSHLSWTFPQELNLQLRNLCQANKTTLFMALVAAVKVLLYRYSGQHDLSIGTEIATRNHPQLQGLIGLFLNTLVLRDRLDPNQGYQHFLEQVSQTVSEALAHSDYPFDRLLEDLNISREINRTPLFDVLVLLQNFDPTPTLETLDIQSLDAFTPTSKFDLSFVFSEDPEKIRLDLIYNTDLFQKERMEKCLIHFEKLLTAMLVNPQQAVGKISLLSDSEMAFIEGFIRPIPRLETRTVLDDFAEQVQVQKNAPALVYTEDTLQKQLSYQELDQLTQSWAHVLKDLGIKKESICGVSLAGDYLQVIALIAIFKAGGIYLPLRLDEPEERWQRMIRKTNPNLIIVAEENLETLKTQLAHLANPPHLLVVNSHTLGFLDDSTPEKTALFNLETPAIARALPLPHAEDSNYIMFTSGSTGEPKAILGSHGSLRHFINWEKEEFNINSNWRCLQIAQINFDAYLRETWVTLCSGGTLYIPNRLDREDLEGLLLRLGTWKINLLHTVPSVMRLFLKVGRSLNHSQSLLENLKVLVLGGEPLFVKELCEWHQVFGSQTEFVNIYGASETTFVKHFYRVRDPQKLTYGRVPGGKTLPDAAYAVVEDNRPCAIGEVGEVFVKSPYLTKGYYQDKNLTDTVFVPNPLNEGKDLVYRTGDLGRMLPDLTLEVLGRGDNQIKLNGVRIELAEIEDVLAGISGVEKALVIANKQEELVTVIAYYQGDQAVKPEQIRQQLKQLLPIYMQPSFVVGLEAFPLLPNGKVNRLELPKPEEKVNDGINGSTVLNQTERALAAIWSELLEVEVKDNQHSFFELGGNSLKAMRLVSQIRHQFGVSLRLREIFTQNTLKEQAILIQSRQVT